MSLRLLNAKKLAIELGREEVSPLDKGYYLFVSFVAWLVVGASGFTVVSPLWTWMSFIEVASLIVVHLLGFSYAYRAAGGDENRDFVVQFTCLYVPVSITSLLVVWGIYWGILYGFQESLVALSDSHFQFALNLSHMGSDLFDALAMLAVIIMNVVIFYRITKLLEIARAVAQSQSLTVQARVGTEPA